MVASAGECPGCYATHQYASRGDTVAADGAEEAITRLRLRSERLDDKDLRARFVKDLEEMEAMVTQTLQPIAVAALVESLQND